MAKKKKNLPKKRNAFNRSPFSDLKGFAVSVPETEAKPGSKQSADKVSVDRGGADHDFVEQMTQLGVKQLRPTKRNETDEECSPEDSCAKVDSSERELFLQAMGELNVDFQDHYPTEDPAPPSASARRMKQLRRGQLLPDASLDLHGSIRADVPDRIRSFLQNARHHGWQTLVLVTGRGLHSADGEPVLRRAAEDYLAAEGGRHLVEWGRAPKQFGGDGALILFMKK